MAHTSYYIEDLTFIKLVSEADEYIYLPIFYGSTNKHARSWSLKLFNMMVGRNTINGKDEFLRTIRKGWSSIAQRIKEDKIEVFFGKEGRLSENFIEDIMELERKALMSSRTLHDFDMNNVEFLLKISSDKGVDSTFLIGEEDYFKALDFYKRFGNENIFIEDMIPLLLPSTSEKDIIANTLYHKSFSRRVLKGGNWYALHMGPDYGYFYGYRERDEMMDCLFRRNIKRAALFPTEDEALEYLTFLFEKFPHEGNLEKVELADYISTPIYPYYLDRPNLF